MQQKVSAEEMRPLAVARQAEALGYHSVWFPDHVVMERHTATRHPANESGTRVYGDRPVMLDVVTTMAAVAAATERVRLASSVLILPYRHPLNVAHQFATIDVLSGGRVIMGVGSGWARGEFDALGVPYEKRGALTEESVELIRAAWTQDWLDHDGVFFRIEDVSMDPKPLQKPHPPIAYGTSTPIGARRAARVADAIYPMFVDTYTDPSRLQVLRDEVIREADRLGRDISNFDLYILASALITDGHHALARQRVRPTLTGTSEQILVDLDRFASYGCSLVNVNLDVRSGTMSEYEELLDRFAREVLPDAARIEPRAFT